MPQIVKATYKSICDNSNGHEVVLISKYNYKEFIKMPTEILYKVNKGEMSLAHLSDFMRLYLLYHYGGLWIDPTFLITAPLSDDIFEYPFFSIHNAPHDNQSVAKYRYFVSFMHFHKGDPLVGNCLKIFKAYWLEFNKAVDYLFMDYCIDYISSAYKEYKDEVDRIPLNNPNVLSLLQNYETTYSETKWDECCQDTTSFKLNWKVSAPVSKNGEETFYGHILNMAK